MSLNGVLLVWVGLMGLAGTGVVYLLLRAYPRAFVESGSVADWPWRGGASKTARARGALLAGAGVTSLLVTIAGIARLLSPR